MVTKAVPRNHCFKTINVTKNIYQFEKLHKFYTFLNYILCINNNLLLSSKCIKLFFNSVIEHNLKIPMNHILIFLFVNEIWKLGTIMRKVYLLCTGCTNPAAFFQHEEFSRSNPKVYNNMNVQKWWGLKLILYFSEVYHYMYLNLTCLTFYG